MEIYLVGGAVRDKLLGLEVRERDWVVVGATPERMIELGYQQVGRDFPVFLHPQTKEEYALARTERKTGPGYKGFEVHAAPDVTLEDDLRRRDLTINAMAVAEDGTLIDPFGGREDLAQGVLRHVSPAFAEDPVRILRVARFAARFARWGFRIAHGTHALMKRMVEDGEVDALVPERVWAELARALEEHRPARFFEVLHHCGALARLMPELDRAFGAVTAHDAKDGAHSGIAALDALTEAARMTPDARVRFAALMHALAPEEAAAAAAAQAICVRFKAPSEYRDLAVLVARYRTRCAQAGSLAAEERLQLLEAADALRRPERFKQFLQACEAIARAQGLERTAAYAPAEILSATLTAAASVSAADLANAGLNGEAIAVELRRRRIEAIAATQRN